MQSFIVLTSLVFELAGGQNDPPPLLSPLRNKKHLSPLRVRNLIQHLGRRSFVFKCCITENFDLKFIHFCGCIMVCTV